MDNLRCLAKKSPAPIVLHTLKTALVMPPSVASSLIDEVTKPTSAQKTWIKRIGNSFWKGALIAEEICNNSDADAIRRLRRANVVIFEIHGGGFRTGNCTMYMTAFISWLKMLKEKHGLDAVIMSVEYGLAPKYRYPEPVHHCLDAYKHLTQDLHVPGSKIIVSGDSAGGALMLETMMRFYAPKLLEDFDAPRTNTEVDLPAGMVLISPLVTPETTSASWGSNEKHDLVTQQLAKLVFKEYLDYPNVDPDKLPILRLAKIDRGFERFAPKNVLVFVGDKEVMRDDIMNLVEMVEKDGKINVRVCKENYAHCWYVIRELVKQKDKVMLAQYDEVFADFVARALEEAAGKMAARKTRHSAPPKLDVNVNTAEIVESVATAPADAGLIVP